MIAVAIVLEDQWNYMQTDRDIDIMQMYVESLKILGIGLVIIIDRTTEGMFYQHVGTDIEVKTFATFDEAFDAYPDLIRVYLSQEYKIDVDIQFIYLPVFTHPIDDVLYIFGGDGAGLFLPKLEIRPQDIIVTIPVEGDLWQLACIGIVLYDRLQKVSQWR